MAKNNRVFIAFAAEDAKYRDFLVGQAANEKSPFSFTDMSVKEPWSADWKTKCRTKIKGCDGMIALISKTTCNASGACWEMNCANEEKVPLLGMHIDKDNKGTIPAELAGKTVIEWTWPGIKKFLDSL